LEPQDGIKDTFRTHFARLVNDCIENSRLFRAWRPETVDRALATRFLVNYDQLVRRFPSLIALGAARTLDEEARAVLALNLYQECGEGDLHRSHHAIFRKFLATAGIGLTESKPETSAKNWYNNFHQYINETPSPLAAFGAIAAGEYLAQPALGQLYSVIEPLFPGADVEYFTTHLAQEVDHIEDITQLLVNQVERGGAAEEIMEGFDKAIEIWRDYFEEVSEDIFQETESEQPSVNSRDTAV
jgi:hypothetical protein